MRFPKKRATGSARPFAQLFKVMDLIHEAIVDGVPATKRDMYYKDVTLFKKQNVVDNLVDDLAATFEIDRADLNVRAMSKGLVCGSGLTIHLNSGESVHATDTEGALIPAGEDIETFTVAEDVGWVLIVEKDARQAIFQTLCRVRIASHPALPGRGLIITGKGYPDVATRQLVATLSACLPRRIPLLGLVDGDPYGIDILAVYKYGSRAMAHEVDKLAAPRVKYLGVLASELASYGVDRDALLPITKADEKKALTMLGRPIPAKWRKELSHILHARRKAEIEVLASASAPARRDEQMRREAMRDLDSSPSTSQSMGSGPGWDSSTPPTSQDVETPPESALVRYLVAKIGDYVGRAKARDE
ncbi:topoisomerase acting in meiosis [Mycena albidolilacea]|uniref:DNA topoisomerase (ATP-hydrolyzing) n=1 Tax=Mycena albidolilacea TaxID=1033008 RepID=A0AAD7A036_9AGAR|nr:topoisomerase acting in meiosis [Mycena albidolilacea]